jgi:subfamily B ATP-binding cassette protein MsbA
MRLIRRALHYYREETGRIILLLVMIAVGTGSLILQVFPLAILVDYFAGLRGTGWVSRIFFHLTPDHPVAVVIGIALFYLILKLLEEVLRMFQTLLSIRIGYSALMRVRCDLFRKLQELSLAYHRSQPQGDAIYRLSWDTYGIQTVVQGFIQSVVVNSLTLVYMAVIMFANNWRLTLVALAVAPLLYWTTKLYARVLQAKATEAKEVESQLTTTIQRSSATIGLVQAFNREKDEYQRFHTNVTNSVAAYLRLHWQEVLFWLMVGVILAVGASALLGYGGYLVYQDQMVLKKGDAGFTPGQLTIFFGFLMQLYGPLKNLSGSASMLATGVAGCKRVFEVLDRDPVIRDLPGAISLPKQPRVLELDRVVFRYREGSNVLDGVSCRIHPGEMVAFVGSSGVGKTTLLNLLPRFYDPVEGSIRLDGHDLREIRVSDVRRHIALVLQENVVLPTSIRENIAYGRPDATDEQIRQAAELAGASGFIEKLEHQYDEQISESGSNLSGGQRQRISIARALLTEAPIIIMDEPTSALDPQHEQLIIETLKKIKGQRTLILVSHRLSTVADCDQIFVMEAGKIIEQGRHEELIRRHGLYWTMARHQLKLQDDVPGAPTSTASV